MKPDGTIDIDGLPEHLKAQLKAEGYGKPSNSMSQSDISRLSTSNPELFKQIASYMKSDGTLDMDSLPEHLKSQLNELGYGSPSNKIQGSDIAKLAKTNPELFSQLSQYIKPDGSIDIDSLTEHLKSQVWAAGFGTQDSTLSTNDLSTLASKNPQLMTQLAQYTNPDGTVDTANLPQHLKAQLQSEGLLSSETISG